MARSLDDMREDLAVAWKNYTIAKEAHESGRAARWPVETTCQVVLGLIPDLLIVLSECEEIDADEEEG